MKYLGFSAIILSLLASSAMAQQVDVPKLELRPSITPEMLEVASADELVKINGLIGIREAIVAGKITTVVMDTPAQCDAVVQAKVMPEGMECGLSTLVPDAAEAQAADHDRYYGASDDDLIAMYGALGTPDTLTVADIGRKVTTPQN